MGSTDSHESPESSDATASLSLVVIPLLKGVLTMEEHPGQWNALLGLQARVRDYVAVLGLELILDEAEGYAFLRSRELGEADESDKIPRLITRRQLSFPVSLLLALLRKKLAEFDAGGGETRLILSRDEIVELVRVFLPAGTNEAKIMDQMDAHLNKIVDLGFIRRLGGARQGQGRGEDRKPGRAGERMFEVRRIIKAFVDAQWLAEFDARLTVYQEHLAGRSAEEPGAHNG